MLLVAIYFIVLQFMIDGGEITVLFSTFLITDLFSYFCFRSVRDWDVRQRLRNFAAMSKGATKWMATSCGIYHAKLSPHST